MQKLGINLPSSTNRCEIYRSLLGHPFAGARGLAFLGPFWDIARGGHLVALWLWFFAQFFGEPTAPVMGLAVLCRAVFRGHFPLCQLFPPVGFCPPARFLGLERCPIDRVVPQPIQRFLQNLVHQPTLPLVGVVPQSRVQPPHQPVLLASSRAVFLVSSR